MTFDLKKSVQEYTDLTIFGTPKSDISEREGNAVEILRDVLTQSPEVQQAFNQAVCQQTDRVFHGWDYWLGGQTVKSVRSAILYNSQADCSNSQQNRQLTVDLLNPQFSKISFAGQYVSSPELEEFKNLYVTGEFKLADDLSYVLDALPDFRTDGAKARVVLTSLIPAKWLAYIGLFGGAFSFGFGTAKVSQAIQELNQVQDEKQRKEAIRDLARGSSTMLLSLLSMLSASRNFDWSAGKNVTRLPTAANKIPEQPKRAVLPEDKITPIRSEPSPTSLNQKPATDDLYPQVANDNAYPLGNSSGPNGSPPVRFKGEESFSNNPVQSLRSVAAGGSGRVSMSSAASQKAEEMCEGAKYSFNGNAALALKPTPVQTIPIPVSTAPGQGGNGAALPANSPLIFSDYHGEHVSHASLMNLKGVEEYLAHLVASFPAILAAMMSGGADSTISEKVENKKAIDEANPMVEIVEGFFKSYLENLAEALGAKLVSRTMEEEIAFQRESVPWREIPPEIVAFAERHPTARMWRLEVRPGGLADKSLNAEQIFFRNLLDYFHSQLNLSNNWNNWIGTTRYGLDNKIDLFYMSQLASSSQHQTTPPPLRQMIIPPILFLLQAPTIFFGDRAVRAERTEKLSSEPEMETMADNNARPLITSDSSENLPDHYNIFASPALKWLHDLSHIIELSRNNPETREDFRKIRYAVKAALGQLQINLIDGSKLDIFLSTLLEGTSPELINNPHLVFQELLKCLPLSNDFVSTLYQQLQIFFPEGHPRREEVLDRFRRAFAYTPPVLNGECVTPLTSQNNLSPQSEVDQFITTVVALNRERNSFPDIVIRDEISQLSSALSPGIVIFIAWEIFQREPQVELFADKKSAAAALVSYLIPKLTPGERIGFARKMEEGILTTDPESSLHYQYVLKAVQNIMAAISDTDSDKSLLFGYWERMVSVMNRHELYSTQRALIFSASNPEVPLWRNSAEAVFYLQLLEPILTRIYSEAPEEVINDLGMSLYRLVHLRNLSSQDRSNYELLIAELMNHIDPYKAATLILGFIKADGVKLIDHTIDCIKTLLIYLSPLHKIVIIQFLIHEYGLENSPAVLLQALMSGITREEFSGFLRSTAPETIVFHRNIEDLYWLRDHWEEYSHLQSGEN